MRTSRRAGLARLAISLGSLGLALWPVAGSAASLEEIRKSGQIKIAVYNEYAPFHDDGKGIDVDVAKALAAKMGLTAEVKGYPDADSVDGDLRNIIWKGHPLWREKLADVMMHIPVDPRLQAKNEKVVILAPYFNERIVVARNKNVIPQLVTLEVFAREKVGVQVETIEDMYLVQQFGGLLRPNVVHFGTTMDAAFALKKNEVAAVMGRQTHIEAGLGDAAGKFAIGPVATPGMNVSGWDVGVAVNADFPELAAAVDQAMMELHKDGTIERIFTQRGLTYRHPTGSKRASER
jgi:ABC-type amino acid transport substrate-binding protein